MTIGSPSASAPSGPGMPLAIATRELPGDHVRTLPNDGRGWFVVRTRASASAGEPSSLCTISPDSSSARPVNASD